MRILVSLLLFCAYLSSEAQNFLSWKYNDRYFIASVGTGSATFLGDVNPVSRYSPGIQTGVVALEARLLSHVSARFEGSYYQLKGKDAWAREGSFEQQRNHSFVSNNWEGNFQVLYYLKPYAGDYFRRTQWDPYIGVGIGITGYNPYRDLRGERYFLRDIPTEPGKSYGTTALIVPLTAGVKYKINDFMNINLELSYRWTNTDYLDDVSTVYPDVSDQSLVIQDLANPKDLIRTVNEEAYLAMVPGAPRGNDSARDGYLFTTVRVEFYLPPKIFGGSK